MKGKVMKRKSDKKYFARTAQRTRKINLTGQLMRGGIRL